VIPNPDKPEENATKAQRHKGKLFVKIHFRVFVSWWRKCFAIKSTKFTIKVLKDSNVRLGFCIQFLHTLKDGEKYEKK